MREFYTESPTDNSPIMILKGEKGYRPLNVEWTNWAGVKKTLNEVYGNTAEDLKDAKYPECGLMLHGGEPSWSIDAVTMKYIRQWLANNVLAP